MTGAEGPREPTGTPAAAAPPGRPQWVKVLAIVAGAVIVVVIAVMIISGGEHGPGRHLPGGNSPEGHTPPVQHGG